MKQITMLAIFAIALALGLMTGVMVVQPNIASAAPPGGLPDAAGHRDKACDHDGGKTNAPHCQP